MNRLLSCFVYWMVGLLWLCTSSVGLAQDGSEPSGTAAMTKPLELLQSIPEPIVQESEMQHPEQTKITPMTTLLPKKPCSAIQPTSIPLQLTQSTHDAPKFSATIPVKQIKHKELSFGQRIKRFWQKKGTEWLAALGGLGLLLGLFATRIHKWAAEAKASRNRLRLGIALILIGILLALLGFVFSLFYALGTILIIIGLIILILELLEV